MNGTVIRRGTEMIIYNRPVSLALLIELLQRWPNWYETLDNLTVEFLPCIA